MCLSIGKVLLAHAWSASGAHESLISSSMGRYCGETGTLHAFAPASKPKRPGPGMLRHGRNLNDLRGSPEICEILDLIVRAMYEHMLSNGVQHRRIE